MSHEKNGKGLSMDYVVSDRGRRNFLSSSIMVGGMSLLPPSAMAAAGADVVAGVSPAMERAWRRYLAGLEQVRKKIYGSGFASDVMGQAQAHYLFHQAQALAFNSVIAQRQDYPIFYSNILYEPLIYTWAGYVPDFLYCTAFVDGARTYRIRGQRGTTRMVLLQVSNSYWNDPPELAKMMGFFDLDEMQIEPDGSFELIASATRQPGNWLPLDASSRNNVIGVRNAFYDWSGETAAKFQIEAIDGRAPTQPVLDEEAFIARMDGAVRHMNFAIDNYAMTMTSRVIDQVGHNVFYAPSFSANRGASPAAIYNMLAYDLSPGEALIIESEIPDPKFWNLVLTDVWGQCLDYTYHQSSLNGFQARIDRDGKFRIVLSPQDPGVPNWVDTVGTLRGQAVVRWYFAQRAHTPQARKVPLDSVREYLPSDTPTISPAQRQQVLVARRSDVLRRYGH